MCIRDRDTTATVSWGASSDNVGVIGYNIYSGSNLLGQVTGTSANITGLTVGVSYTIGISAYDAAGNESSINSVTFTTGDPIVVVEMVKF